jgi:hypothetical protein
MNTNPISIGSVRLEGTENRYAHIELDDGISHCLGGFN